MEKVQGQNWRRALRTRNSARRSRSPTQGVCDGLALSLRVEVARQEGIAAADRIDDIDGEDGVVPDVAARQEVGSLGAVGD